MSDAFCERLIQFYNRQPNSQPFLSVVWDTITVQYHKDFIAALVGHDLATVKNCLRSLNDGSIMFGFDLGKSIPISLTDPQIEHYFLSALTALNILPVFNPEQPNAMMVDPEEYLKVLESKVGFQLSTDTPPGKTLCLRLDGRNIPWWAIYALCDYATIKLLNIWPVDKVIEIGAGAAAMQYIFWKSNVFEYHAIDIPVVAVIQAYMISCLIGEERIWLSGETMTTTDRVFIHGLDFKGCCTEDCDLLYNRNSMPEIPEFIVNKYLDAIIPRLKSGGVFLSVNHESSEHGQTSVDSIMSKRTGMVKERRCRGWNREGYVEEVWRKP